MSRLLLAALLLAPLPAAALQCGERQDMIDAMAKQHGVTRQSLALTQAGGMIETFANRETGSWAFLLTEAGKPSCIVGFGTSYEATDETLAEGEPA